MKRSTSLKTTSADTKSGKQMITTNSHHLLGHTNRCATIKTAKYLGQGKLKDSRKLCQPYTKAKAKQKTVPQSKIGAKIKVPNKCLYHNVTMAKAPMDGVEKVSKMVW